MTDSSTNPPSDDRADEPLTWAPSHGAPRSRRRCEASAAASLLESLREAIDDMTERATPTVREVSARVAELTATAASKAAPLAKKAGDATADASDKLAERSRHWAAEVREAMSSREPRCARRARVDRHGDRGSAGSGRRPPSAERARRETRVHTQSSAELVGRPQGRRASLIYSGRCPSARSSSLATRAFD